MRKATITLLYLLFFSLPITVHANSTRTITPSQWQQLSNGKPFSYVNDVETVKQPKTIEPGIIQKILLFLFGLFGSMGTGLLWALVIGVIIFILYKLFAGKDSFMFSRKAKKMGESEVQEEEDIAATNWEALLQQATNNNDLRLAVRYSYMWLLQILQQHELIQYRTDKTNYEYSSELDETDYKKPFKQLSRQYEYAWYGQFALSATAYREYADLFTNIRKQLGA